VGKVTAKVAMVAPLIKVSPFLPSLSLSIFLSVSLSGGHVEKLLLVLFVLFSASNSVLRLMLCYSFHLNHFLSFCQSLPLYLSLLLSLLLPLIHPNEKLNKASKFAGSNCNCSTVSTVSAISSICLLFPFSLPFSLRIPRSLLANLHVSFRWKITPFKNLLYVLPEFSVCSHFFLVFFFCFHLVQALQIRLAHFLLSYTLCWSQ